MKAYFLEAHPKDGIFTLVIEGVMNNGHPDVMYYPFKNREDLDMALEALKDIGVDIEK